MRTALLCLCVVILGTFAGNASADEYVNGYWRSNGTYVQPYYRSDPNGTTQDNFSTRGNVNPYTGQPGYKSPYDSGSGGGLYNDGE